MLNRSVKRRKKSLCHLQSISRKRRHRSSSIMSYNRLMNGAKLVLVECKHIHITFYILLYLTPHAYLIISCNVTFIPRAGQPKRVSNPVRRVDGAGVDPPSVVPVHRRAAPPVASARPVVSLQGVRQAGQA